MKKSVAVLFCLLMVTVSLAGCFGGDDNESSDDTEPTPALGDWDVYYVTSSADLPNCNSETLGRLYYVEADAGFQTCTTTGWSFIDLTGPAGADGIDGTNGTDGADGIDGTNGTDGAPGAEGSSGTDGQNALAITSSEPPGSNCADGGIKIEVGVDNSGDGALQSDEIDQTNYVCNGTQGADGKNGSASANTMLTGISTPAASLECFAGGRVITQGLDNGDGGGIAQNGILESGEIDYTTSFCSTYGDPGDIYPVESRNTFLVDHGLTMEILVGDTIYFSADDGITGTELWAYNTTNQSTWQVADIYPSGLHSIPGNYLSMLIGDTIYFDAIEPANGRELWAHDTSNHSTWRVTDINSGGGSNIGTSMGFLVGDTIYFSATDGNTGEELWAHDTSNQSTWQVADIVKGSGSSYPGEYLAILVGDKIYFSVFETSCFCLWAHNTSNQSTWQVANIALANYFQMLVGNTIYFSADDGSGIELWAHDTSNHSTWQAAEISNGNSGAGYYMATLVGKTIYFSADDGSTGTELWAHDTTNHSTWQVVDINNNNGSGSFPGLYMEILVDDTIYFSANDGNSGAEMWAHDTSSHRTWQVADIKSGSSNSWPGGYLALLVGDIIYFNAADSTTGSELWAHDTSNQKTWQLGDINSGSGSSSPGEIFHILAGDKIYFSAYDGNPYYDRGLWVVDLSIRHVVTYE